MNITTILLYFRIFGGVMVICAIGITIYYRIMFQINENLAIKLNLDLHQDEKRQAKEPHKMCKVNVTYDLRDSGLLEIQNERKSRIREVCEMCRRNRSSEECNHITMDEDEHGRLMYDNLIVDDKHKVRLYSFILLAT